jgi:hypothetical protein
VIGKCRQVRARDGAASIRRRRGWRAAPYLLYRIDPQSRYGQSEGDQKKDSDVHGRRL